MGTLLLPMAIAALAGTWAMREPLWGVLAAVPVIAWQLLAWRSRGRERGAGWAIALTPLAAGLAGAAWIGPPNPARLPGRVRERVVLVGRLLDAPRLAELVDPGVAPGSRWLGSAIIETDMGARVRLQLYVWAGEFGPGDRIRATGRLSAPRPARNPGEFDAAKYLDRLEIVATLAVRHSDDLERLEPGRHSLARGSWRVRAELSRRIALAHEEPERGLIAALALGRSEVLDPALTEGFSETGLLHALAVSGMHLALLAWMARRPIGLIVRRPVIRDAAVVLLLAAYAALVGVSPSVVRSLAVAMYVAVGGALGRRSTAGGAFGASLLACLLADPRQAFELGFALSFAAILGLAALDGLLGAGGIRRALAASVAAWIATAAPSAELFGRLAPWGIPLSVLVVVPMGALLLVSLLDCAVGELVPLAPIAGAMARAILWVTGPCERMDLAAPSACWVLAVPGYWALVFRLLAPRAGGEFPRRVAVVLLLAPVACALWPRDRGHGELWVFDGGRAHAALVLDAHGGSTLVDAGLVGDPFLEARILRPALRRLGVGRIDRVVLADPSDPLAPPVRRETSRIDTREVWTAAIRTDGAMLARWLERGAQLRWLPPGPGSLRGPRVAIGWWAASSGGLAIVVAGESSPMAIASGVGGAALRDAMDGAATARVHALGVLGEFALGIEPTRLAQLSGASCALVGRADDPPQRWRRRAGAIGMRVRWTAMDGALRWGAVGGRADQVEGWVWHPR